MADKDLRKTLDELDRKKEDAFQRKQDIGTSISEKIGLINEYRRKRNSLTNQVRSLKTERDALNTQITERIAEIKKARPKAKEPLKDNRGRPIRPGMLQRQIKQLETKLETVPMKFDQEQKLTKHLKDLKKQYAEIQDSLGLSGDLAQKSKEIDELKKTANELHDKVTVLAKESQEYHEKMLSLSEEIDDLKRKEEEAYKEFLALKEKYVSLAGEVREDRIVEQKQRKAERAKIAEERRKQEEEEKKSLKERAKEAEQKMVKGEKLTTEDLLALQSVKE